MSRSRGAKKEDLLKTAQDLANENGIAFGRVSDDEITSKRKWLNDQISHHILRLAFCSSIEKRRWFAQNEATLFQARLEKQSPEQLSHFMHRHSLMFEPVPDEQKALLSAELKSVFQVLGAADRDRDAEEKGIEEISVDFQSVQFYKVSFTKAIDLVKGRRVLLRGGYAYVPHGRMISILLNRFKMYLNFSLVSASKYLPQMLTDTRLEPVLKNMSTCYTGPVIKERGERVTPESIEKLSHTAFPLCMSNLQAKLREKSHLKHGGRMQYGLFLKGIGLSMEDALIFWQREFSKNMSADDFIKKYAYNIRHNYGKEGKRANYTPYSCTRIILGTSPAVDDAHGCPYRHWDHSRLRSVLGQMRLPAGKVDEIMRHVLEKNYQIACVSQFNAKFPNADEAGSVGNHPNGYFDAAMTFLKKEAAKSSTTEAAAAATTTVSPTGVTVFSSSSSPPPPPPPAAATSPS
jgi:DNA primase large subunit